jgi:DNA polymerase-3 subunit beta
MAAADGFRLAVHRSALKGSKVEINAVLPVRALAEVARVASGDQVVTIVKNKNQVIFCAKDVLVVTQVMGGQFPDYQKLIPTGYKSRVLVSTSSLRAACRQAVIFSPEETHATSLTIKADEILVSSSNDEVGSGDARIQATLDGDGLEIAFNVKYLLEGLEVIESPSVALEMNTSLAPGLFKPVGDENFLYVAMPLNLG